ncbi:MAG: hypothetical protein ACO3X1_14345 [Burkholderiaceae bacterium]
MTIYDFSPPSFGLVDQWLEEWDLHPDAHCDSYGWVAAKAAEWGYQQCLGQFEQAAMQIVPPGDDFEPDNDD